MADEELDGLIDVAGAIADGLPVDWRAMEAGAVTPEARDRIRRLEWLAGIGRLRAQVTEPGAKPAALHDSLLHPGQHAAVGSTPATPVTWGPLTVIAKIGQGTFGDVYRARETRLDRDVALKLLRHRDAGTADGTDVIEEARLMARIRHPNVMTIYGADRIGDRVGLWMELIDGRTLEEELKQRGPLPADELRHVAVEMAAALTAVHDAGLLHRDVKAHNVMRARDGRLLLTDFGTGGPVNDGLALSEQLAGSPLYLAPEVLDGAPATVQSDLYSLGVLLFHLATGSFPVTGESLQDLRMAHAAGLRAGLRFARPDLPARFSGAVDRALSARPSDRHATAADFARSLVSTRIAPRQVALLVASLAITAAAVFALWTLARPAAPATVVQAGSEERMLTGANAAGVLAAASDGRHVAYLDGPTGNLGVHDLSTDTRRLLTSSASWEQNEFVDTAVFSRDGQRLAYTWVSSERGSLRLSIRVIDRDRPKESPPFFTDDLENWMWVHDWSDDGRYLALAMARRGGTDIALLALAGGQPITLRTLDWRGTTSLAFSPDGRHLAYDHPVDATTAQRDVSLIQIDRRESRPLVTGSGNDTIVDWSGDGDHLLVASDRRGIMSLWEQRVVDGRPDGEPLLVRSGVRDDPVGVTDDGRFIYRAVSHDQVIAVVPADLDTGEPTGPATAPITPNSHRHGKPKWSADGRWLAHMAAAPGNGRQEDLVLSIQSTVTGQARSFRLKLRSLWTYSWSPDNGSFLARAVDFQQRHGIFRIDANTGEVSAVLVGTFGHPQWTRDGQRFTYTKGPTPQGSRDDVVFERDLASGTDRVVLQSRDLVTPDGAPIPAVRDWNVSPDGTHAAGLEAEDAYHAVWVVRLGTRVARQVYRVDRGADAASCCGVPITHNALLWTPDGRSLIVNAGISTESRQRRELWVVPIAPGEAPRRLDIGTAVLRNDAPGVSPDGQVAFLTGEDVEYEIRAVRVGVQRPPR